MEIGNIILWIILFCFAFAFIYFLLNLCYDFASGHSQHLELPE